MPHELILKKLERIEELLKELERLLRFSFSEFRADMLVVRTAERDFQLIVDLASDINTQIIVEKEGRTPDTYKESFSRLEKVKVLDYELAQRLVESAQIRNILVHEYDFDEDYEKFFNAAKEMLVAYKEYARVIYEYVRGSSQESFKA